MDIKNKTAPNTIRNSMAAWARREIENFRVVGCGLWVVGENFILILRNYCVSLIGNNYYVF